MSRSPLTPKDFLDRKRVASIEGGALYTADLGGKFYVIQDETTMAQLLSEEDAIDLESELIKVWEFDTPADRARYLHGRGSH